MEEETVKKIMAVTWVITAIIIALTLFTIIGCAHPADIAPGAETKTPDACKEQRARDPKKAVC